MSFDAELPRQRVFHPRQTLEAEHVRFSQTRMILSTPSEYAVPQKRVNLIPVYSGSSNLSQVIISPLRLLTEAQNEPRRLTPLHDTFKEAGFKATQSTFHPIRRGGFQDLSCTQFQTVPRSLCWLLSANPPQSSTCFTFFSSPSF